MIDRFDLRNVGAAGLFPLGVLFGLNAVDELYQSAFNVLLPDIRDAFGLSNTTAVLVSVLAIPAAILVSLPMGFLGDRRRRVRLAGIGAGITAGAAVATALAASLWILVPGRIAGALGRSVTQPTHQGLLADWYPPKARAGVYSMWRVANPVGVLAGSLIAGGFAWWVDWRLSFAILTVPALVFAAMTLRLTEPRRGVQERVAAGADAEQADLEEEPASWQESWRAVTGVATMRRVNQAVPWLLGGMIGINILLPLFYEEVFGVGAAGRGFLMGSQEPFTIVGIVVGVPFARRLLVHDPARMLYLFAVVATVTALGFVVIAAAPSIWVAAGAAAVSALVRAMLLPGLAAVFSLVLPPRVRSFAFAAVDVYALPGLLAAPAATIIGAEYGLRVGILVMVPVFLIGGYLVASAGLGVQADMRANQIAALARAESRRQRLAGDAKLLLCRSVEVRFGHSQVLFGVDFEVGDGEIVALVGTNGAGKTTLLNAVNGVVACSGGAIVYDGRDITHAPPQRCLSLGISYMPGGQAVFPTLTVAENLRTAAWSMDDEAPAVEDVLRRFPELRTRMSESAGNLSGGQQQMLGLAMAFLAKPRLLLIDELSLGLSPAVVAELLDAVRELNASGTTVVIVEQSINLALTVADRAVFLERGQVRFDGTTADLLDRPDVLRSVYLTAAATSDDPVPDPSLVGAGSSAPVLSVSDMSHRFGGIEAVSGVDFSVQQGGVLGVIGPNGAGKSTLFDLVSGHIRPDRGHVSLNGTDVSRWSAARRATAGLGRSFQDAHLFPAMTVSETLTVAATRHIRHGDAVSAALALPHQRIEEKELAARVHDALERFGIGHFASHFVGELSTGSRRVVELAATFVHDPAVLLLDEPTSGLAQREGEALIPLLRSVAATGCALVVIEHDIALLRDLADEFLAMDRGRVIATGPPEEVLAHPAVIDSYLGGDVATTQRSGRPQAGRAHQGQPTSEPISQEQRSQQ